MGKKHPYYGKSMSINFPDFPHTMGFVAISRTVGMLWRNPCISHMLKYSIGWESDGKKAPILWEKYEYQFPRLSPYHGFCCIFPYCGKFMGKPKHFPYAEVYHRIWIGWKKGTHTIGKVWVSVFQTFAIAWVLLHFPILWEIYGETYSFPIWWHRLIFSCATFLFYRLFDNVLMKTFSLCGPRGEKNAIKETKTCGGIASKWILFILRFFLLWKKMNWVSSISFLHYQSQKITLLQFSVSINLNHLLQGHQNSQLLVAHSVVCTVFPEIVLNQRIHFAVLIIKSSFNFLGATMKSQKWSKSEALGSNYTFKDRLVEHYTVCPN